MASNEHVACRERKGVNDNDNFRTVKKEEYLVLKAKAELYDEYLKQSRFLNKTTANKED